MSEEGINYFFDLARERYRILLRRRAGQPKPWTTYTVFHHHPFCNVRREDDKTTIWFKENIRERLNSTYGINPAIILLSIVAFRWFNRIETWDTILSSGVTLEKIFWPWKTDWIKQELLGHAGPPWVTGAYIIKTPDGKDKLDGVLWCIDQFNNKLNKGDFNAILEGNCSHQEAQALLETSPYLGRFMGYQIIADARYTQLLEKAPDINTWAQPGPGSSRGIGRVFFNDVDKFKYGSKSDEKEVIKLMQELLLRSRDTKYWPSEFPALEMQDIQNWLCEYDKVNRIAEGGRMKRKYNAT